MEDEELPFEQEKENNLRWLHVKELWLDVNQDPCLNYEPFSSISYAFKSTECTNTVPDR